MNTHLKLAGNLSTARTSLSKQITIAMRYKNGCFVPRNPLLQWNDQAQSLHSDEEEAAKKLKLSCSNKGQSVNQLSMTCFPAKYKDKAKVKRILCNSIVCRPGIEYGIIQVKKATSQVV